MGNRKLQLYQSIKSRRMPEDDDLPTYEEATRMERVFPRNITQQFSRSVEDQKNGSRTCVLVCLFIAGYFILAVVMIIIGQHNSSYCPHSFLTDWLIAGGSIMLILGALLLIFCKLDDEREEQYTFISYLIGFAALAGFVCYILGCVWTWSSLSHSSSTGHKSTLDYEDGSELRRIKRTSCNDTVLYFSFFLTLLPFIILIALIYIILKLKEKCSSMEDIEEGSQTLETD